jgi:AcrR family transcriptional regulator
MSQGATVTSRNRLPAEERKAAIVRAAVQLFSEKGFRGTTTRELAAAVGVSEPVLYQHFATKSDLYSAIIEAICRDEGKDQDSLLVAARDAENDQKFFSRLGELMLRWYEEEPEIIRLLLFSALEGHELKDRFVERQVASLYGILNDYIERRMRKGKFRKMDPYLAARIFTGMVNHQGLASTVFGIHDLKGTREEIVSNIVDVFLRGMKN